MSLFPGNVTHIPDEYKLTEGQGVRGTDGRIYATLIGYAKLTTTLQATIPLWNVQNVPGYLQTMKYPPKPISVPVGAQIHEVSFRLPGQRLIGDEPTYGMDLPKNATIVGTTGENLKVSPTTGTTHTTVAPVITAANNSYSPYAGAVLARDYAQVDQASPSLITKVAGSPLILQMTVSNAGNTAAGTGIRINASDSAAIAYIAARIIFSMAPDAVRPQNLDILFPDTPV